MDTNSVWQVMLASFARPLGTKLEILFEIAKSVERVIILGKKLLYPEILDFTQEHYFVATFVHIKEHAV